MNKIVVASMRKSVGKTSVIVGLAKAAGKKIGYMKPFGDRLLYKKKRRWDYDSALITDIFDLKENPEDITLGFEHAKLKYMYDEAGTKERLKDISERTGRDKDALFIKGGPELAYGASVNLDSMTVARSMDAKLVLVVGGEDGIIADDIAFLSRFVKTSEVKLVGVIINSVRDVEEFKHTHFDSIAKMGVPLLGVIPYTHELAHLTVGHIAERLFAKVITGEGGMNNLVENVFVGAMSANIAINSPLFKKENKLIITSGDRSDMIVTAIETNAVGIVLTNNLLPPANLISRAGEKNIPMFLVPNDTFQIAKQIDNIEPLLSKDDTDNIELLGRLIKDNVNLAAIL